MLTTTLASPPSPAKLEIGNETIMVTMMILVIVMIMVTMVVMLIMMISPIKNGRDKPPLKVTSGSLRSSRVTSKDDE